MKYVTLEYRHGDDARRVLLEGDRRQTVDRMVEVGLESLFEDEVEPAGDDAYRLRNRDERVEIRSAELVASEDVEARKRELYTVVVNENVTENACRVSYSH